jgi:hypothetical protein
VRSNGRAEALNAQINALITRARGFRSAAALIAMAEFTTAGYAPIRPTDMTRFAPLTGRNPDT